VAGVTSIDRGEWEAGQRRIVGGRPTVESVQLAVDSGRRAPKEQRPSGAVGATGGAAA
jgi:hypothetical protein